MRKKLDANLIKKLYCEDELSSYQIGEQLGCWPSSVAHKLCKLGCIRSLSEANKLAYAKGRANRWWPKGEANPSWKGGISTSHGYPIIMRPDHPKANSRGYVREHLLVWEEAHGKPLPDGWVIHHLNGIKTDNRPSNLLALPHKKHANLIPTLKQKIRELEIENGQLRRALDNTQPTLSISEN